MDAETVDASVRKIAAAVLDRVERRSVLEAAEEMEDGILLEAAKVRGITEKDLNVMPIPDVMADKSLVDSYAACLEKFLAHVTDPAFATSDLWKKLNGPTRGRRSTGQLPGGQFARQVLKWRPPKGRRGSSAAAAVPRRPSHARRQTSVPTAATTMVQAPTARQPVLASPQARVSRPPTAPKPAASAGALAASSAPHPSAGAAAELINRAQRLQQTIRQDRTLVGGVPATVGVDAAGGGGAGPFAASPSSAAAGGGAPAATAAADAAAAAEAARQRAREMRNLQPSLDDEAEFLDAAELERALLPDSANDDTPVDAPDAPSAAAMDEFLDNLLAGDIEDDLED